MAGMRWDGMGLNGWDRLAWQGWDGMGWDGMAEMGLEGIGWDGMAWQGRDGMEGELARRRYMQMKRKLARAGHGWPGWPRSRAVQSWQGWRALAFEVGAKQSRLCAGSLSIDRKLVRILSRLKQVLTAALNPTPSRCAV